jgi:hypothetical protein
MNLQELKRKTPAELLALLKSSKSKILLAAQAGYAVYNLKQLAENDVPIWAGA